MAYSSTAQVIHDLEKTGQLIRLKTQVDPYLEIAEIQRRLYAAKAPAVLFENVKGSPFPALANLYGTLDRVRYIFRETLRAASAVIRAKADISYPLKNPALWPSMVLAGIHSLPRKVSNAPVLYAQTTLDQLPQITAWPKDGGAFITLPQVCSEDPHKPGIFGTNLGMYRVQLAGNSYAPNAEVGLHYQIHRGIGVHHQAALEQGKPLRVSIFVGGPPAHAFAAVMPLPESMPEVVFAGLLAGRAFRYTMHQGWVVSADADFCILGEIAPDLKPEGPFGDHLGYYSLQHEFPYLKVKAVYHRKDAVWPFTVVGRPPQEDTSFGEMIHEIASPMLPSSVPGVSQVHAVDASGVHPLALAIGSERYVPYATREPLEILTQANALLGFNQISLAKYLFIAAREDVPSLDAHDVPAYLQHVLQRIDFSRDLHFQTRTTMDTLDYSGGSVNHGSKLVLASAGAVKRELAQDSSSLASLSLPDGFRDIRMIMPGVLSIQAPAWLDATRAEADMLRLCAMLADWPQKEIWPLVTIVDDSEFVACNLNNWLWVTFTRSNPSHDIYGVKAHTVHKHWACEAPLIIDARIKAHHATPLVEDPAIVYKVDALFASNGPFARFG